MDLRGKKHAACAGSVSLARDTQVRERMMPTHFCKYIPLIVCVATDHNMCRGKDVVLDPVLHARLAGQQTDTDQFKVWISQLGAAVETLKAVYKYQDTPEWQEGSVDQIEQLYEELIPLQDVADDIMMDKVMQAYMKKIAG